MEQTGPSARARQAADRAGCPAPPFHNNSNNYGASPITLPMSSRHVSQVSQRRPPSPLLRVECALICSLEFAGGLS